MYRPNLMLSCLIAGLLGRSPAASALTVIVPDQYSTIQAAVNSGASTVLVREGVYPGSVTVASSVSIEAYTTTGPSGITPDFPWLQGDLTLPKPASTATIVVKGLRISGRVNVQSSIGPQIYCTFEGCRVDSGMVLGGTGVECHVRYCTITRGGLQLGYVWRADLVGNTVVGGIQGGGTESGPSWIRGNFVIGPAATGIAVADGDGDVRVRNNLVTECTAGITSTDCEVILNEVTGCSGDAISVSAHSAWVAPRSNVVTRCGGRGIVVSALAPASGTFRVTGNQVTGTNGNGIEVAAHTVLLDNVVRYPGGNGIIASATSSVDTTANNTVVGASTRGIDVYGAQTVRYNVVGRCGSDGIRVATVSGAASIANNTTYLNSGDGIELNAGTGTSVSRNIAHGNGNYGLRSTGISPALSCNDWYSNTLGATSGVSPGGSDQNLNPLFCDLPDDDVRLSASSPLNGSPCGQIGALGLGCATATGVPVEGAPASHFRAVPSPANGAVEFRFAPTATETRLEVFDATGALRYRATIAARTERLRWEPRDDSGTSLPVGVYFARLHGAQGVEQARVVVLK